ncbi:hypothetical protein OESDEN_23151 [Oesophagostomum dentatum]|uniref:Uncharacterized protein n=1 Tax=Oesophagostomum dentatum TaxID=61180 RepID=A0A0B1RX32_OESDE|nr:hypothetical protein OESDEN_23151 [Oesophagostomum dentatum]
MTHQNAPTFASVDMASLIKRIKFMQRTSTGFQKMKKQSGRK